MNIDPYIVLGSAVVGFLVGLTGAGGGALMTPMLILLFNVKPSTAILVTITDSSPDSITEIPQALIGVVGLFGV